MPPELARIRAALAAATGADQRAALQAELRLAEAYQAEVGALQPALPTIAFERTMTLYRRDREIQLLFLGRAHTEGDIFVYLPAERVVITGDAVIGWTPFMGDGYPEDWARTIDRLAELDWTRMIMGHGDPAGRDWLRTFRGYVHDVVEAVRQEAARGATLDEVKQRVPDRLAPTYERAFSAYASFRPWRAAVLANVERIFAAVS
jgi:glyoxylase-like metal-dependent hydrolase (beta-lactamase superfamily II)